MADKPAQSGTEGGRSGYDVFRDAVDAVKAGEDPNVAIYGEGGAPETSFDDYEAYSIPEDTNSTLDDLLKGGEESGEDVPEDVNAQEGAPEGDTADEDQSDDDSAPKSAVEELVVSTPKGRKKVKIDFSSDKGKDAIRARVRKSYDLEKGMRKFQTERDEARISLSEMKDNWDAMEAAYSEDGVAGLVNLIEGNPNAFEEFKSNILERENIRQTDPDQWNAIQSREREEKLLKAIEREREEAQKLREQVQGDREAAELSALESRVNPAFDKHRFAGKLGDANREHRLDKLVWNDAMESLSEYEEQGIEITPRLAEKAFKDAASLVRTEANRMADKKVSKAVKAKKRKATEHVQTAVAKGQEGNSAAREAHQLLQKQSGVSDILKNWGKFGKVFK